MPWLVLVLALMSGDSMAGADLLVDAAARFDALQTYRVTLRTVAADGERQVIRYAWRRPGWVRMDFVEPHGGTVLIYDPAAQRVQLWPFGTHHIPTLKLAPDNPLIRGPRGHGVEHSDVGALLANLRDLRARGSMSVPGEAEVATRAARAFEIVGEAGASVAGVHRYRVWLAQDSLFPLLVQSYGASGELIESVDMGDAELDIGFPEHFFVP